MVGSAFASYGFLTWILDGESFVGVCLVSIGCLTATVGIALQAADSTAGGYC